MFPCVCSRDRDLISKCGDDARIYITFQYHLIVYMLILCIPSLGVILPINYSGNVLGRQSTVCLGPGPGDLRGSLDLGALEIWV